MKVKFIRYKTLKDVITHKPIKYAVMLIRNENVYYKGVHFYQSHFYYTKDLKNINNINQYQEPVDKPELNRKLDLKKYHKVTHYNIWEQMKNILRVNRINQNKDDRK